MQTLKDQGGNQKAQVIEVAKWERSEENACGKPRPKKLVGEGKEWELLVHYRTQKSIIYTKPEYMNIETESQVGWQKKVPPNTKLAFSNLVPLRHFGIQLLWTSASKVKSKTPWGHHIEEGKAVVNFHITSCCIPCQLLQICRVVTQNVRPHVVLSYTWALRSKPLGCIQWRHCAHTCVTEPLLPLTLLQPFKSAAEGWGILRRDLGVCTG